MQKPLCDLHSGFYYYKGYNVVIYIASIQKYMLYFISKNIRGGGT